MKEIEGKLHAFAEELYRNAQASGQKQQASQAGPTADGAAGTRPENEKKSSGDDEVIDADFRMVDDDK